jgi:hypothetical protein
VAYCAVTAIPRPPPNGRCVRGEFPNSIAAIREALKLNSKDPIRNSTQPAPAGATEVRMSTITYAQLTNKRDAAPSGGSKGKSPPGVATRVDAPAALVPAEVLSLHALITSFTSTTTPGKDSDVEQEYA